MKKMPIVKKINRDKAPDYWEEIWKWLSTRLGNKWALRTYIAIAIIGILLENGDKIRSPFVQIYDQYRKNHPLVPKYPTGKFVVGVQFLDEASKKDLYKELQHLFWKHSAIRIEQVDLPLQPTGLKGSDVENWRIEQLKKWILRTGANGVIWGEVYSNHSSLVTQASWIESELRDQINLPTGAWISNTEIPLPPLPEESTCLVLSLWLKVKAKKFYNEQGGVDMDQMLLTVSESEESALHGLESSNNTPPSETTRRLFNRLRIELFLADPVSHSKWDQRTTEGKHRFDIYGDFYAATGEFLENIRHIETKEKYQTLFLGFDVYMTLADHAWLTEQEGSQFLKKAADLLTIPQWRIGTAVEWHHPLCFETIRAAKAAATIMKILAENRAPRNAPLPANHLEELIAQIAEFETAFESMQRKAPTEDFLRAVWRNRLGVAMARVCLELKRCGKDTSTVWFRATNHLKTAAADLEPFRNRTPRLLGTTLINLADAIRSAEHTNINGFRKALAYARDASSIAKEHEITSLEETSMERIIILSGKLGKLLRDTTFFRQAIRDYNLFSRINAHPNSFSLGPSNLDNEMDNIFIEFMKSSSQEDFENCLLEANFSPEAIYKDVGKHFSSHTPPK